MTLRQLNDLAEEHELSKDTEVVISINHNVGKLTLKYFDNEPEIIITGREIVLLADINTTEWEDIITE